MTYYWILTESKVTQLNPDLYAGWVANGNPKAEYYQPIPNPPGQDYYFDGTAWVQYPPPPAPPLTRLGFLSRFTDAELVAIKVAEFHAPDPTQRAMLQVLKESWLAATEIDVTDPRTQQGVMMLVGAGLLAENRVAAILAP